MASRRDFLAVASGRRRWGGPGPSAILLAVMAFGVGGAATLFLGDSGLADWMLSPAASLQSATSHAARVFPVCAGATRVSCVVDGDTFWLEGVKYRVADIDTPEIGQPGCSAEAALGREATSRFARLLSSGPFELRRIDRDEDQYGRKLRIVEREGQSLGQMLVREGLAHEWRGRREGWC